jgi:AraC-like DNA-binding protein
MPLEIHLNLHPINLIIISGILQTIILSGILVFYRNGNKQANRLFGLFLFICSLHFLWPLIIDINLDALFSQVFWFPYSYLLAIGPLLFFYSKSLTNSNFRIGSKEAIHFIPVLAELFLQVYFISESVRSNTLPYSVNGFLVMRIVERVAAGISILMYGGKSLSLIREHESWLLQHFSNQKDITLSWLLALIKYLRVLWIFWLLFELSFTFFWRFQIHLLPVYLLLYILLGVITYSTYWIGIQGLIRSESLTEIKVIRDPAVENTSSYSRLSKIEIQGYVETLGKLMLEEKLFLHEELSLLVLAQRLKKEPNLVSYLLNNILHKSFYDYINELRIEEVKSKMNSSSYAHFKIVEIAFECGFKSKATFNRVFKRFTGKSPSEYKNDIQL